MKRNTAVALIFLVVFVVFVWAGVVNYRHRRDAYLRQTQAVLVPDGQQPPADAGSDGLAGAFQSPLLGKPAPGFTLEDTAGRKVSLADYKGKAVLINFWATWCGPCKIELPWLVDLQKKYGAEGFQVLGVSADDLDKDDKAKLAGEKQQIAKFAADMHLDYPVLLDGESISKLYGGVDTLPMSFYVDRSGKVVKAINGLASRDEIEASIKLAMAGGQ